MTHRDAEEDANGIPVLFVFPHLAHYRRGVFEILDHHPGLSATFAADTAQRGNSIPTMPSSAVKRFRRLRNLWIGPALWQRGLIGHVLRRRYSTVVFVGDVHYLSTWIALLVLRFVGRKSVLWTIGWHQPDSRVKHLVRMTFYRLANAMMLYGVDGYEMAVKYGLPKESLSVIGNSQGVYPSLSPSLLEAEEGDATRPITVGAVVRFTAWKRLDLLLQAAAIVQKRNVGIRVMLVGDGPERQRLERLGIELGLDVEFTGAVYDRTRLEQLHSELDITVLPERAGLTVMQSLTYGVPVITADDPNHQSPEFRAVVPGVTGSLYQTGSILSLASAIEDWVGRVRADSGNSIRQACQDEIAQNWSPEAHAGRILQSLGIPGCGK